jgi:hypothetical protein
VGRTGGRWWPLTQTRLTHTHNTTHTATDIFLGYHSEEGWKALAHVVTSYYGLEVGEGSIYAFVAIVPVVADAFFKLWIFKGLNRANPGAAVTLKQMDRH